MALDFATTPDAARDAAAAGADDDCNGMTDEGLGSNTCGTAACATMVQNCVRGVTQTCHARTSSARTPCRSTAAWSLRASAASWWPPPYSW
ncbi:MAG: hypothetical protein WCJ30_11640 [Deltaproteobacteria bacterium]